MDILFCVVCEIGKISLNVQFLHKYISLFDLPFLDDSIGLLSYFKNTPKNDIFLKT